MHRTSCATATLALALAAGAAAAQDCAWEFFPAPTIGNDLHLLYDVDGLAADDVWAVGRAQSRDIGGASYWTYALHFDGTQWTHVPTPNPDDTGSWNDLMGVLTLAPDDVWAVGSANPPFGATQSIAMRWDGGAWSMIDTPFYEGGSTLNEIELLDGEIWAVGTRRWDQPPPATSQIALALRWNGSGWDDIFVPPLAELGRSFNELFAIDGVSADDLWAVGFAHSRHPDNQFGPRAYMVHFDGSEWSIVNDDFGAMDPSGFADIEVVAADDIWAVGWTFTDSFSTQPLIVHYDGSGWTRLDLPNFAPGSAELRAVTARAADDVYAMGTWADAQGFPADLILHYDGTTWTQMDSAPVNGEHQWYRAATTLPNGDVWTVGQFYDIALENTIAITERLRCEAGGCPADMDGDGDADVNDFFSYLDFFAAGDARADITGDGSIDVNDFFAYLDAFAAGC